MSHAIFWLFHANTSVALWIYNIPPPNLLVGTRRGVMNACFKALRSHLPKKTCPASRVKRWDRAQRYLSAVGSYVCAGVLSRTLFFPWKIKWSDMIGISRAHAWICLLFCCCQQNKNHIRILNHCGNTFETCWLRSCSLKHRLAFFSCCLHTIVSHSVCLSIIRLSSHSTFLAKQQTKLDFSSPKIPTYKI